MTETVFCSDKVYLWLPIVIIDIYKYTRNKNDTETSKHDWLKNNSFFFQSYLLRSKIYICTNVVQFCNSLLASAWKSIIVCGEIVNQKSNKKTMTILKVI